MFSDSMAKRMSASHHFFLKQKLCLSIHQSWLFPEEFHELLATGAPFALLRSSPAHLISTEKLGKDGLKDEATHPFSLGVVVVVEVK